MSERTQREELYTLSWKEARGRAVKILCKLTTHSEIAVAGAIEQYRASVLVDVRGSCHDEDGLLVEAPPGHPAHGLRTWREADGTYILTDEEGDLVSEYEVRIVHQGVQVCNYDPEEGGRQ